MAGDLIYACKPGYEDVMKRIQKIFQVEDKKISTGSFRFCGREIRQAEDFTITAFCKDTTEKLEKINYRTQVKKDSPVNEGEKAQLRSVVGSLAWIARQARPDLSYKVSKLQSKCNRATIKDLVYANLAIDEAREHSNHGIIYKSDAINWRNCSIVTVSAWSNEDEQVKKKVQKYKSQRARMTILVNPDFTKKEESAFHDYHQKDLQKHITSRDLWRQLRNRRGHETPSPNGRNSWRVTITQGLGNQEQKFPTTHLDHRLQIAGRTSQE